MAFAKAQRKRAKARIGLVGPAGSGKTMSALKIAKGLVGANGRIAVIDTEHGSASLYAHLFDYDVLEISSPFTVKKYLDGIRDAEKDGYDALIIDSLSHAWAGEGGLLEQVDNVTASKNKFTAWRNATPQHNSLVEAMLQSSCHIIATMRAKTEYVLTEVNGKQVPKKVGMAPVQREGMDYEFTLVFDIDQTQHLATTSKDRTEMFDSFCGKLSQEHGQMVKDWLENGAQVASEQLSNQSTSTGASTAEPTDSGTIIIDQAEHMRQLITDTETDLNKFLTHFNIDKLELMPLMMYGMAVKMLEKKKEDMLSRKSQGNNDHSKARGMNQIISILTGKKIDFSLDEARGSLFVKSYAEKDFLKSLGFKWETTSKAWVWQKAAA